jgi:hypothetical protein
MDHAMLSSQIMSSYLPQIANELAMDITPVEDIKKLYGLDDAAWDAMIRHPAFDKLLQDALITWASATNTESRIKFKAMASVEMSILRFHTDINNPDIVLSSRTEALKTLMKLAGIDRPEAAQLGGNGGWSLNIILGDGRDVRISPTGPSAPPTIDSRATEVIPNNPWVSA